MNERPDLDALGREQALDVMSEADFEDFLTEAIGLYAEETRTPIEHLRTFSEDKLLLSNRGLVVGLGRARFRVTITRG